MVLPLIVTILILLFAASRQASTFRHKEKHLEQEIEFLKTRQVPPTLQPTYSEPPPEISHTDPYWAALSDWYREQKHWTCEHCGLNLEHRKQFLHTHHTRGRAYNSPEHLQALCVKCHAGEKFPIDHSFMKDSPEYREFMSGEGDVDDER